MPLYPPLLLIVFCTGSFWIQGHRTEQSTHYALQLNFLNYNKHEQQMTHVTIVEQSQTKGMPGSQPFL